MNSSDGPSFLTLDSIAAIMDGEPDPGARAALQHIVEEVAPTRYRQMMAGQSAPEPSVWEIAQTLLSLQGEVKISEKVAVWAFRRHRGAQELMKQVTRLAEDAGLGITADNFKYGNALLWHREVDRLLETPFESLDEVLDPMGQAGTWTEAYIHIINRRLARATEDDEKARLVEVRAKVLEYCQGSRVGIDLAQIRLALLARDPMRKFYTFVATHRLRLIRFLNETVATIQLCVEFLEDMPEHLDREGDSPTDDSGEVPS